MRISEWIIVAYLAYLVALSAVRPLPVRRLALLLLVSVPLAALVCVVAGLPPSPLVSFARMWLPLPCILLCYWLSGVFFVSPQEAIEARFAAFDRRVRAALGAAEFARVAPRAVLEFLEVAYFGCYVVLPAGMVAFLLAGRADLSDRFWSTVLLAELACYAVLPWIRTRPAWVLHPHAPIDDRGVAMRRLNLLLVRTTSTHANTFPSGHAAGALATALAVWSVWPLAGLVFLLVAVSIAAGSVVGEYHYAGDALTGAAVAIGAWVVVALIGI